MVDKMKDKNFFISIGIMLLIIITLGYLIWNNLDTDNAEVLGEGDNQATFVVESSEEESNTVEVNFEDETTMFALMEAHLDALEEDGLVYSIDGVEQDEDAGMYWVYDLNGEMGLDSAVEYEMQDGDLVEWRLESF